MSKELMYILITKMHVKLNDLIESNDFDLMDDNVQTYSRRLDRVLTRYNRALEKDDFYNCQYCPLKRSAQCIGK